MKFTYTIPESLDDITVGQFQTFMALPDMDEERLSRNLLRIICGIPTQAIDQMPSVQIAEALKAVDVALAKATTKTNQPFIAPTRITIDGVVYGLHPNLNNMTMGEFVDMDTYAADIATAHKALAVLYRPIKSDSKQGYEIELYKGTAHAEAMRKAPISVKFGLDAFFLTIGNDLQNSIQRFSAEVTPAPMNSNSAESGVGILQFSRSLADHLSAWKRQLNLITIKPCTSWLTMRTRPYSPVN